MDSIIDTIRRNVYYILGLILLGLTFLGLSYTGTIIKNYLSKVWQRILLFFGKEKKKQKETFDKKISDLYNSIRSSLIELRVQMDADRAYIFEFHNGETFLSNKPRWKMSKTFEVCRDGISYEYKSLQNLDVTLFWDSLRTLFIQNENELLPGIIVFRKKPICKLEFCKLPRTVFLFDRDEMDPNNGQTKIMMETQNVKYQLISPILNNENLPVGYIGIDYCNRDKFEKIIENPSFSSCYLCRASAEISLAWELNPKAKQRMLDDYKLKYKFNTSIDNTTND